MAPVLLTTHPVVVNTALVRFGCYPGNIPKIILV